MISSCESIKDEPVAEPAGEPHSHPSTRHRGSILIIRHRIVERPVEVTERNVDSHSGNRKLRLAGIGHTR